MEAYNKLTRIRQKRITYHIYRIQWKLVAPHFAYVIVWQNILYIFEARNKISHVLYQMHRHLLGYIVLM